LLYQDVLALTDQTMFSSNKINFLLDATLGLKGPRLSAAVLRGIALVSLGYDGVQIGLVPPDQLLDPVPPRPGPRAGRSYSSSYILQPEFLFYQVGAFYWHDVARVDFQVILHVFVDAIELPSRQSNQSIPALTLSGFKNVQRSEHTDQEYVEGREQVRILRSLVSDHDFVNDQIVSLPCHGGNRVPHATEGTLGDRPLSDDDQGLAAFVHGFEGKPVGVSETGFGQHLKERIHLNVEESIGRYCLKRFRYRAFACTADAVEKDNSSGCVQGTPSEAAVTKPSRIFSMTLCCRQSKVCLGRDCSSFPRLTYLAAARWLAD
jgi:hypothetical protein